MGRKWIVSTAALICLLFGRLPAQGQFPPNYRSRSLGQPVPSPESLSGLWEAPDGKGGAVGLHLQLTTTVPADVSTLSGVPQSWLSLNLGVYQRKGATIQFGEQNYFSDSHPDSSIHFEKGRLQLHFISPRVGLPSVDLDLFQQSGDTWVGRLHRGDFDAQVKLLRPGVGGGTPLDALVGTWSESSMSSLPGGSCLHIAQRTATELTGWSDSLQVLGSVQFANQIPRPATAIERYGELMKIHREEGGSVSFGLGAFAGVCCPHTFLGRLTSRGDLIQGTWPAGPNQAPRPGSWRKMPGNSCIHPVPVAYAAKH